jgi:hypothetical protein
MTNPTDAPIAHRRRRSRQLRWSAALVVLLVVASTGCIRGVTAGRRCATSDFGEGGGWVMRCERGRWVRKATTADVARALANHASYGTRTLSGPSIRIAVGGDSTGGRIAHALERFQAAHPGDIEVLDLTMDNCTLTFVAQIRHYIGESGQDMSGCGLWSFNVPQQIAAFHPDVALVFAAMMEQADQRTSLADSWHNVVDPNWAARQLDAFRQYTADLSATGATVLWADVPIMRFMVRDRPWVSDAPVRTEALNALIHVLDGERSDVEMLDYASRLNRPFGAIDTSIRPDGIHLTDAAADDMVSRWLVPLLDSRRATFPTG